MQKSPPNPQFNELLAALPNSEAALLERARVLQAQGDLAGAAELLRRANDRCPTPAINAALQASQRQNAESDADPVTQELDELEVTTLESQSLELNAFERPDELDDSDIFAGGSFDSLSSLEPADDSPTYTEGEHVETDELQHKSIDPGANDESVNELLVDLGLPVAAQDEDDYNATRTIVGRIDDALGIQRDDLLADDSEFAQRDFYGGPEFDAAPDFDAEPLNAADFLDADEDVFLEQDTAPRPAAPIPSSDAFGDDDLEWDDGGEDEWDDVADTQFQMQMPLNPPVATPALSEPAADWRLGNDARAYDSDTASGADEVDAIELDPFQIPDRSASRPAQHRRTDRLFAVDAQRPIPAPKRAPELSANASPGEHLRTATAKAEPKVTLRNQAIPSQRSAIPPKMRKYALPMVAALLLLGVIAGGVMVGSESSAAADAIQEQIAQGKAQTALDTYQNYLNGERILSEAIDTHGPMGASIDGVLSGFGMMGAAEKARGEALAELVHLRAMIEYRYEYYNTRDSEETARRAEALAPGNPNLNIARAYQMLSKSHYTQAIALLGQTRKSAPNSDNATIALIHAQLAAGDVESASMATLPIRAKGAPSVHEHYLLGMVDLALGKAVPADARFRHILTTLSPTHISARIKRSQSVRQTEEPKALEEATALLKDILEERAEQSSPLQLAKAHNAMAEVEMRQKNLAKAEEHNQQAIKTIPQRSVVYTPMVELFIHDGRLEKALQLIKDAEDAGVSSTALLLQRAELYRLTARFEMAIKTIESAELRSAEALWKKGLAYRDMNRPDQAAKDFATALKMDEKFAPARASSLLLAELAQSRERTTLEKPFERVLKNNPKHPSVLHDGALALLHIAQTSRAPEAPLARAKKMLDDALEYGGNPAVIQYTLCEYARLKQDEQAAIDYCDAAQKNNPRYLPGVLSAAKLHLKRDKQEDAFFDRISRDFPNDPRVSQYHALHWLNQYDTAKAEAAINRWAGTPAATSSLHLFAEGRLAFSQQKYTAALGYFERASKQSPNEANAAVYFAQTLSNLGEHDRAEAILKPALDDIEWGPAAWVVFGQIRREQSRVRDASQNLAIAGRKLKETIASKYWITQHHLQTAMTYAARYDGAHRLVERELQRASDNGDPDDPALNLAWSRYHLAQRRPNQEAALKALQRATDRQPSHCGALKALKTLYNNMDGFDDTDATAKLDAQISQYHCEG